jgi:hypothetical protein
LKEQQDGMDEIFKSDAKRGEAGEGEISYCDFVDALIKVSVLGKKNSPRRIKRINHFSVKVP